MRDLNTLVALSLDYKRSQLRLIHLRLAPAASKTLQAYLLDAIAALPSSVAGIGAVRATAGNGHTVEFFGSNEGAVSLADAAALYSELLDLYDEASTALVSAGTTSPTDDQVYGEMMDRLRRITTEYADFRNLHEGVMT